MFYLRFEFQHTKYIVFTNIIDLMFNIIVRKIWIICNIITIYHCTPLKMSIQEKSTKQEQLKKE